MVNEYVATADASGGGENPTVSMNGSSAPTHTSTQTMATLAGTQSVPAPSSEPPPLPPGNPNTAGPLTVSKTMSPQDNDMVNKDTNKG